MKDTVKIKEIAFNNLIQNKKRTILTITTVSIAVSLMLIVLTYLYSDDQRNKRSVIDEVGESHVQYENITNSQLENIVSNKNIKKYFTTIIPNDIVAKDFL
ncbi:MAG: hypothetical protein ABF289_17380 [Clostridiales bacterium]